MSREVRRLLGRLLMAGVMAGLGVAMHRIGHDPEPIVCAWFCGYYVARAISTAEDATVGGDYR